MRVFDRTLSVEYGQAYLESGKEEWPELDDNFESFANGMCGTAVKGWAWFNTATYAGNVRFTFDVLDEAPPLNEEYEDVVEATFIPIGHEVSLWGLMGEVLVTFVLEAGAYRIRYCARNADAAEEQNESGDVPDVAVDEYLVQLWPAPAASDEIVKQTSAWASRCHQTWGASEPRASNDIWNALSDIPVPVMESIVLYATEQFLPIVGIDQDPLVSQVMAEASLAIRDHVGDVPPPGVVRAKAFEVNERVSQQDHAGADADALMDEIHGWVVLEAFLVWFSMRGWFSSGAAVSDVLWRVHGWSHGEWPRIEIGIWQLLNAQLPTSERHAE